ELAFHRAASLVELTCTDFAPLTVMRLREHFEDVTVVQHDLRTDEPLAADLHILHRVDTELSDAEWPEVLRRFREAVLFVATELVGLRPITRELVTRIRHPHAQPAGWIRTESALERLWRNSHDARPVPIADLPGYVLTR